VLSVMKFFQRLSSLVSSSGQTDGQTNYTICGFSTYMQAHLTFNCVKARRALHKN